MRRKYKRNIFISSRIDELLFERSAVNHAYFEQNRLPLMFGTEPIEGVKFAIDNMIDSADHFWGIYFHTVGFPQYELYEMTPIEYELEYRENILFRIRVPFEQSLAAIRADNVQRKKGLVPWTYRGNFLQSTEIILRFDTEGKHTEKHDIPTGYCLPHSALSSIVGVESVHVAPVLCEELRED